MHYSRFVVFISVFSIYFSFAMGQSYPGPQPLLSPSINGSMQHSIATQVGDSTVKYGFDEASLGFKFPLYTGKDWMSAGGNKPLFAVLMNSQGSVKQTSGDFFFKNKQLLRANAGASALLAVGLRNLYMVSVQTGLAEDLTSINPTRLRFSGNAFWRHRNHDQFNYTLGVSYSYVYGRNVLLPILGFGYHFTKADFVNVVLPFNIHYTHRFDRRVSLSAFLKPDGGSYYLNYQLNDSVKIADVVFRQRSFHLGVSLNYKTFSHFIFIPEIGLANKTRFAIDEYKTTSPPSLYFKLGLRYRFGKRATAAPILNFDPGDFGIEQNDYREE